MAYTKSWSRDDNTMRSYYVDTYRDAGIKPKVWANRVVSESFSGTYGEEPGWRNLIRNRNNATTTLSIDVKSLGSRSPASFHCYDPTVSSTGSDTAVSQDAWGWPANPASPSLPGLADTAADNAAKSAFLKRLINEQRSFSGGVALGELRETLHMIRNPALAIRRGLDDYFSTAKKRASRASRRSKNRVVQDTWLEYNFGWAPFLSDIRNGSRALKKLRETRQGAFIKASGQDSALASSTTNTTSWGRSNYRYYTENKDFAYVKYFGFVDYSAMNPQIMRARLLGFSWQDFVPTLWELTPWSFLVDYFTNIGDVIEGWSWGRTGLAWSSKTLVKERMAVVRAEANGGTYKGIGWIATSQSSSYCAVSRKIISRSRYTGSFTPSVTLQLPGFGNSKKYLNIAALVKLRR